MMLRNQPVYLFKHQRQRASRHLHAAKINYNETSVINEDIWWWWW